MAETAGNRSRVTFVLGLLLGLMLGSGAGVAVGWTLFGAGEPEVAVAPPPPAPAPVVVAPPPAPAPEPPTAAPAPEREPRPARKPAPAPATPPPAPPKPTASASRTGPTDIVFIGEDGKRYTADAVPPGKFEVHANWGSGVVKSGEVTVREGKALKLLCDPPTRTCTAK